MHRLVPSEPCPELDCAESEQIVLNDRCCKVCRGTKDPLLTHTAVLFMLSLLIYRNKASHKGSSLK